jgi:hypothetical protein
MQNRINLDGKTASYRWVVEQVFLTSSGTIQIAIKYQLLESDLDNFYRLRNLLTRNFPKVQLTLAMEIGLSLGLSNIQQLLKILQKKKLYFAIVNLNQLCRSYSRLVEDRPVRSYKNLKYKKSNIVPQAPIQ